MIWGSRKLTKMVFENLAKDLLNKPTRESGAGQNESALAKADNLLTLANNGFALEHILRDLRDLYDNTEEDSVKRQILDMMLKVYGMYQDKDRKESPQIIFNVKADPNKMNRMLCPLAPPTSSITTSLLEENVA